MAATYSHFGGMHNRRRHHRALPRGMFAIRADLVGLEVCVLPVFLQLWGPGFIQEYSEDLVAAPFSLEESVCLSSV